MEDSHRSLPKHAPALDTLRTLAICLVFATHFASLTGTSWFQAISPIGWVGVDLFFVLSGFLISSQLFRKVARNESIGWKAFYFRRGLRIWPNYFVVVALYFLFPVLIERSELPPLWKFLTFTQNFFLNLHEAGAFSHAWSLCVEEHFYILLPIFIFFLRNRLNLRKSLLLFIATLGGGMLLRYGLWQHFVEPLTRLDPKNISVGYFKEIYYPSYCRLDALGVGVGIGAIYRLRNSLWQKTSVHANAFFAAGILILSCAYFLCLDSYTLSASVFGFPLLALGFGFLVIAGISEYGFFSRIKIPLMRVGATLAFSVYLTHKSVIHLAKDFLLSHGVSENSVLYPLGIVCACLLVSSVLYLGVERPVLKLRDRNVNSSSN